MKIKTIFIGVVISFLMVTLSPSYLFGQCPMCKISAESNLNNGGSAGKGLNKGILFLFAAPYLIIGSIGAIWYTNRNKQLKEQDEASIMN